MQTAGGRDVDFADAFGTNVVVEDIARALSMTCRFGGHVGRFYSVAEHAVLVQRLVVEAGHPELAAAALHHDSHEAYIGDVPTPLKNVIGPEHAWLAGQFDVLIAEAFGLDVKDFHHQVVKDADERALCIEALALKPPGTAEWAARQPMLENWYPGLTPATAESQFLIAHRCYR